MCQPTKHRRRHQLEHISSVTSWLVTIVTTHIPLRPRVSITTSMHVSVASCSQLECASVQLLERIRVVHALSHCDGKRHRPSNNVRRMLRCLCLCTFTCLFGFVCECFVNQYRFRCNGASGRELHIYTFFGCQRRSRLQLNSWVY